MVPLTIPVAPKGDTEPLPEVLVYVTKGPPALHAGKGPDVVSLEEKIESYCLPRNIACKMIHVDWQVGYSRVQTVPNTLFAAADRTPEREDLFHWVMPISSNTNYYLYGAAGKGMEHLTREELTSGAYSASCAKFSAQCDLLRQLGIPEDKINSESEYIAPDRYHGLLNDRYDLTVLAPANLIDYRLDQGKVTPLIWLSATSPYMVAGLHMDEDILKALTSSPSDSDRP